MFYIIGTPIGNLNDLSFRQAEILCSSDVVLAEDTRSLPKLFSKIHELFHLSPKDDQIALPYYKEVEFEKLPQVLLYLKDEKNVALVSDAGMPLISDPGLELVKHVKKQDIPFTVIPGPTAFVNAVLLSGLSFKHILFYGFLPKKEGEIKKVFTKLKDVSEIQDDIVYSFYESPERIHETLKILSEIIPDSTVSVCREMTKKYESVTIGTPKALLSQTYKGELVLLIKI